MELINVNANLIIKDSKQYAFYVDKIKLSIKKLANVSVNKPFIKMNKKVFAWLVHLVKFIIQS